MGISIWQVLLVVVLLVLLFGRGKISSLMGDVAEGIKNFRRGMQDEQRPPTDSPHTFSASNNSSDKSNCTPSSLHDRNAQ